MSLQYRRDREADSIEKKLMIEKELEADAIEEKLGEKLQDQLAEEFSAKQKREDEPAISEETESKKEEVEEDQVDFPEGLAKHALAKEESSEVTDQEAPRDLGADYHKEAGHEQEDIVPGLTEAIDEQAEKNLQRQLAREFAAGKRDHSLLEEDSV